MRPRHALLALLLFGVVSAAEAAEPPALARARALYNAADYDGAIAAAVIAQREAPLAGAAALVLGRAHLERFRLTPDPVDLAAARDALGMLSLVALTPRDQVDLLVGLGQSLYLADAFGAAADLFDAALGRGALLGGGDRVTLLDWWATALDREAQTRAADRGASLYARILDRMAEELRQDPGSGPANYWRAVAARGTGDVEGAWDAAIAGWVRSTLRPEASRALRADLDRLVSQALVPERARARPAPDPTEALTAMRTEWETVKSQWK